MAVGFLGLGAMGTPMALRLQNAGVRLQVWTRTAIHAEPLREAGAQVADSPAAVARESRLILSCLLDDAAIEDVYLGSGLIDAATPGSVFVEHGTFSPALARKLQARAREHDCDFVDAPVTGGVVSAADGTLACMVGGTEETIELVRPILRTYARIVERVGAAGAGVALKLVNQMLVAAHVVAAAEAAALVKALEIPAEVANRVLTAGWGNSTMLGRNLLPALRGNTLNEAATIGHLVPVLDLVARVTADAQLTMALEPRVRGRFHDAVSAGLGDRDLSAMAQLYRPAMP